MNPRSIWSHHVMGLSWCYWGVYVYGPFCMELECLERHSPSQHLLSFCSHPIPRPAIKIQAGSFPPRKYDCTELEIK